MHLACVEETEPGGKWISHIDILSIGCKAARQAMLMNTGRSEANAIRTWKLLERVSGIDNNRTISGDHLIIKDRMVSQ